MCVFVWLHAHTHEWIKNGKRTKDNTQTQC